MALKVREVVDQLRNAGKHLETNVASLKVDLEKGAVTVILVSTTPAAASTTPAK